MEVKNHEAAILCNLEVLKLVDELKDEARCENYDENFTQLLREASLYLNEISCGQTEINLKNFMKALLEFPVVITRMEKLMMVNNPPRSPLQLSLIIHNCDERLTEEQIEELLNIIETHFPAPG